MLTLFLVGNLLLAKETTVIARSLNMVLCDEHKVDATELSSRIDSLIASKDFDTIMSGMRDLINRDCSECISGNPDIQKLVNSLSAMMPGVNFFSTSIDEILSGVCDGLSSETQELIRKFLSDKDAKAFGLSRVKSCETNCEHKNCDLTELLKLFDSNTDSFPKLDEIIDTLKKKLGE
jgi:hypothetical protein